MATNEVDPTAGMTFPRPKSVTDFTGTTKARVVKAEFENGRYGKQIKFTWTTMKGNRLMSWCNVDSAKQVNMHVDAGVLETVDENGEILGVVMLDDQPICNLRVEAGKVKEITPDKPVESREI